MNINVLEVDGLIMIVIPFPGGTKWIRLTAEEAMQFATLINNVAIELNKKVSHDRPDSNLAS